MGRLFWKFFFAFWGALLAAGLAVGTGVALFGGGERDVELAAGPRAALLLDSAAATLEYGGPDALRESMLAWHGHRRRVPRLFAVDAQDRDLLGRSVPAAALAEARRAAQHPELAGRESDPVRVVRAQGQEYLLFVSAGPRPPARAPTPSPLLPIIAGLLSSLAFSALLAWYFSKPVRHLRWAFGAATEGKLDVRVQPLIGRRRDEVADLGRDFDRMAARLQALLEAQRRLLHDVSHELRSPLARLQAAIGLARQDPARIEASLDRIERESARLDELVGEVLTLSRLTSGTADTARERVDLAELVAGVAEDARFEAQASGRDLQFSSAGEAYAQVHAELLHRAFENVIRNAVKYTAPGSIVEVQTERSAGSFRLRVCDRGPGVPEAQLQAIFEPFYRASAPASGFGLGLAIARRAVEAHGGSIRASNRPGGGLCMEITLPLEP